MHGFLTNQPTLNNPFGLSQFNSITENNFVFTYKTQLLFIGHFQKQKNPLHKMQWAPTY